MTVRIRPSGLKRADLCPGSPRLEEAARPILALQDTEAATTGTIGHGIVAATLLHCTRQPFSDDPLATMPSLDYAIGWAEAREEYQGLSGWDRWAIRYCLRYAYDLIEQHGIEPANVLVEHHLDGADLGINKGGTADLILVVPFRRIIVVDWKLGQAEQDAADVNDQLAGYAIMAARTFRADDVHVHLVSPKVDDRDRRSTSAAFDAAALRDTEQWVRRTCAAAQRIDAPLHPSYEACHYCDALLLCRAAREYLMNAMEALELFGLPDDPAGWGDLVGASKLAERFAEQAKQEAKRHLSAGGQVVGFRLRASGQVSSLRDARTAFLRLRDRGLEHVFLAACSARLTDIREALGPEVVDELIGDCIQTSDKAPSLVACK